MQEHNDKPKRPPQHRALHQELNQKVIDALRENAAPWQQDLTGQEQAPVNPTTGTVYKGANLLHLTLSGEQDPRWMTLLQANKQDMRIAKGSHAVPIAYYQWTKDEKKLDGYGKPVMGEDGKAVTQRVALDNPVFRVAYVFNASQVEGMPPLEQTPRPTPENVLERVDALLAASGAKVAHDQQQGRAYYDHFNDVIHMPPKESFEDSKKHRRYFGTEMEARAFEEERLAPDEDQQLTLGELVALYFRSNPDKHENYRKVMVYFLAGHEEGKRHVEGAGEFLRDKFAERLTRRDLELMRENVRARGSVNNSINKYQAYIRAILAWGVDQQLITHNPWRDYKRLPVQKKLVTTNIMQIRMVYEQADDWLQWAIKTMYALSLRAGQVEVFLLQWTAFDWRRRVVRVVQGKTKKIKTVYPPEKYLAEAFERFQEDMRAGIPLVCHRKGKRVLSYRGAWATAVKKAGLPHFPMYHIRHAAATEMLAGGADLAAVAAQLGHSTVTTTANTYAHVTPGGQRQAAALMPALESDKD